MRADDLAGDADIGKAGFRAQREWRCGAALKEPLVDSEPLDRPVLAPVLDRVSIGAKGLRQMIADPWHHQRVSVRDRHQRHRARIGALFRVLRDQPRLGLDILEIFDDRERLKDRMTIVNKGGYHAPGVNRLIPTRELFSGENIDRDFLERQALEIERHSDPERGNRSPKSLDLNTHRRNLFRIGGPPPYSSKL